MEREPTNAPAGADGFWETLPRVRRPPPVLYNVNALTAVQRIATPKPKASKVTDSVCTAARVGATLTRWMRRYLVGGRAGDDKAPAVANQAMKRRRAATNDVLDPEAVEELQAVMRTQMAGGKAAMEPTDPQQALRGMPELAVVLNFLHTFRAHLHLTGFTAEELETALLSPTVPCNSECVLSRVHMGLLQGIHSRTLLTPDTWAARLVAKVAPVWSSLSAAPYPLPSSLGRTPHHPAANAAYRQLAGKQRVQLLCALCELRLEQTTDLRESIDAQVTKPPKAHPAHAQWVGLEPLFRATPLAVDAAGTTYWFEDHARTTGTRMYSSVPLPPRANSMKGEKAAPPEALWRCVAADATEMVALGRKLSGNRWAKDQQLGEIITEQLAPVLAAKEEAAERRRRVRETLALDAAVILDAAGGLGRSRRERKEVNYAYNAYDDQIRSAIRTGRSSCHDAPLDSDRLADNVESSSGDEAEGKEHAEELEIVVVDGNPVDVAAAGDDGIGQERGLSPEGEYEVQAVLDHRMYKGKKQWLARWKGYSQSHDSWEEYEAFNTGAMCQPWVEYEEKAQRQVEGQQRAKKQSRTADK